MCMLRHEVPESDGMCHCNVRHCRLCNTYSLCCHISHGFFRIITQFFTLCLLLFAETYTGFEEKLEQDCLRLPSGNDYTGRHNRTVSGASCQRWSVKYPHYHNYDDIAYFADFHANVATTITDVSNYCRNPAITSASEPQPWCYTMRKGSRDKYEFCDIPRCKRKVT